VETGSFFRDKIITNQPINYKQRSFSGIACSSSDSRPNFMQPGSSFPRSQQLATCSNNEPD